MARRPPRREARQPRLAGLDEAPPGYVYRAGFLSQAEEARLAAIFPDLPLQHFEFRGFYGKRRVVSYGWRYSFGDRALHRADPIPAFLQPLRERAADFAGLLPESLEQSSVIPPVPGLRFSVTFRSMADLRQAPPHR